MTVKVCILSRRLREVSNLAPARPPGNAGGLSGAFRSSEGNQYPDDQKLGDDRDKSICRLFKRLHGLCSFAAEAAHPHSLCDATYVYFFSLTQFLNGLPEMQKMHP
jgi:hypothetical protein